MIWIRYDRDALLPTIYIIIMGNIHGLFFSLYLLLLIPVKKIFQWDDEDTVFAFFSAFFPFATIWVEKKLAKYDRPE
jgi:integral membrane protein